MVLNIVFVFFTREGVCTISVKAVKKQQACWQQQLFIYLICWARSSADVPHTW